MRPLRPSCLGLPLVLLSCLVAPSARSQPALPPERDPLVRNLDPAADPRADFFRYAVGRWLLENPIPASERGWGIANLVNEETYRQRLAICTEAASAGAPKGSPEQQVGDFWAAGMDSATVERLAGTPLMPHMARIGAIHTRRELLELVGRMQALGFRPLYSVAVYLDERDSERYLVHLHQGGIRMPDRDYYFGKDANTRRVRAEYGRHVNAMFRLLGEDSATAATSTAAVLKLETALAARSRTLEERRDPWANYHKLSFAELARLTPTIDWKTQFDAMGVPVQETVIVAQPEFYRQLDSCLSVTRLSEWQALLRWNVVNTLAPALSQAFDQEHFRFYGTTLHGTRAQRPRWKRTLDGVEGAMGELVGQVWVRRHCSPATKARYERLTEAIFAAYRERLQRLPWMSDATKARALAKLDRISRKVAYPDRWRDYSALEIQRSAHAANQVKVSEWWFRHEAGKLGRPVDRTLWEMTPQTYNAYYDGSKLEIVLPAAAFMIPGTPDSLVDDAILYAYAGGTTIGHEITHGFDDEGRQFDERGNLNPWWTPEDSVNFAARARKLVEQYDAYRIGDRNVRGLATLGENIADLGGVVLAYEAFKQTEQWKRGEKLNGLTPDQRFFLAHALAWMGQRRPEALQAQIMTDVHAPAFLRVNGPLANVPEFHAAFGVRPGDAMYRAEDVRVTIW
jgi:putative endopeptidase